METKSHMETDGSWRYIPATDIRLKEQKSYGDVFPVSNLEFAVIWAQEIARHEGGMPVIVAIHSWRFAVTPARDG